MRRRVFRGFPLRASGENRENLVGHGGNREKPHAGGFSGFSRVFPLPKREKPSAEEENPANLPPGGITQYA
jgi:hypothetical protein